MSLFGLAPQDSKLLLISAGVVAGCAAAVYAYGKLRKDAHASDRALERTPPSNITGAAAHASVLHSPEALFRAATAFANSKAGKRIVSAKAYNDQLRMYGLYKVATLGACNIPAPSQADMRAYYKWQAWNALADVTKDEAITRYVALFDEWSSTWRNSAEAQAELSASVASEPAQAPSGAARAAAEANEDSEDDDAEGPGGSGWGVSFTSRPTGALLSDAVHGESAAAENDSAVEALMDACQQHDANAVSAMIRADAVVVNKRCSSGEYPLHVAVDAGALEIVRLLLNAHADVNAVDSEAGQTALHYAASQGHTEIASALIQAGADITVRDAADKLASDLGEIPL